MENYKRCPLKKRPIVFEDAPQPENLSTKPQDLSVKSSENLVENFALNLSSNSFYDQLAYMNPAKWYTTAPLAQYDILRAGSISPSSTSSAASLDFARETSVSPPAVTDLHSIHLRGLKSVDTIYTESLLRQHRFAPYWNIHKKDQSTVLKSMQYHKISTEWSPDMESVHTTLPTQPEDLSVKCYVPEPALCHNFDADKVEKDKKAPRYKCEECGKSYSTFAGLSKHQQFHCPSAECNQVKKVFSCKSCDKVYTSLGALKMHIRTHTLPCKCNICGKAFSRPWLLQGHIRTHTGEKPFRCQYCHRAFADRSNLRAHLQTHADVKKYLCGICNKSFSRMSLLHKHNDGGCTGLPSSPEYPAHLHC